MKILKFIFSTVTVLLVFSSCKKQLDVVPTDSFTPLNAFRTIGDAQLGTNEAYGRYIQYANTMYQSALVSDEGKLGNNNSGQGALTFRYQFSSDGTTGADVTNTYAGYYFLINQVNRVLAALPTVIATPAEEPRRAILKGQLLALRGLAHFNLLQAYSKPYNPADPRGITYVTTVDILDKPARITSGATIAAIEADMNEAFTLSPVVTAATFTDTVMNQLNINAFRARIALYKGDYANAITYASFVISSGIRPLATTATFGNIWIDATGSPETLFRIRTASATTVGALFTTTGGLNYVAPSNKLRTSYGAGDVRLAATVGGTGPDAYYLNKFYTSSRGGRAVDVKAARTAEMYLIRAEAYAKSATPNVALGTADINTLRSQRITGYTNVTFATAADLITAVADERFKELAFEGFRFFDLKRTGQSVQRDASDVTSASWQTLPAGNFRFVFPLPQAEINANPNTAQNDGY